MTFLYSPDSTNNLPFQPNLGDTTIKLIKSFRILRTTGEISKHIDRLAKEYDQTNADLRKLISLEDDLKTQIPEKRERIAEIDAEIRKLSEDLLKSLKSE